MDIVDNHVRAQAFYNLFKSLSVDASDSPRTVAGQFSREDGSSFWVHSSIDNNGIEQLMKEIYTSYTSFDRGTNFSSERTRLCLHDDASHSKVCMLFFDIESEGEPDKLNNIKDSLLAAIRQLLTSRILSHTTTLQHQWDSIWFTANGPNKVSAHVYFPGIWVFGEDLLYWTTYIQKLMEKQGGYQSTIDDKPAKNRRLRMPFCDKFDEKEGRWANRFFVPMGCSRNGPILGVSTPECVFSIMNVPVQTRDPKRRTRYDDPTTGQRNFWELMKACRLVNELATQNFDQLIKKEFVNELARKRKTEALRQRRIALLLEQEERTCIDMLDRQNYWTEIKCAVLEQKILESSYPYDDVVLWFNRYWGVMKGAVKPKICHKTMGPDLKRIVIMEQSIKDIIPYWDNITVLCPKKGKAGEEDEVQEMNWIQYWAKHPKHFTFTNLWFYPHYHEDEDITPKFFVNTWTGLECYDYNVEPYRDPDWWLDNDTDITNWFQDGETKPYALALKFIRDIIDEPLQEPVELLQGKKASEVILDWLAWIIRYPNEKTQMAPVLEGKQGVGKSKFFEFVLHKLIGFGHGRLIADGESVLGSFNSQLSGAIFVLMEEALFGNIRMQQLAKSLITAGTHESKQKYVNDHMEESFQNVCATTNFQQVVEEGRRWFITKVTGYDFETKDAKADFWNKLIPILDKPLTAEQFYAYLLKRSHSLYPSADKLHPDFMKWEQERLEWKKQYRKKYIAACAPMTERKFKERISTYSTTNPPLYWLYTCCRNGRTVDIFMPKTHIYKELYRPVNAVGGDVRLNVSNGKIVAMSGVTEALNVDPQCISWALLVNGDELLEAYKATGSGTNYQRLKILNHWALVDELNSALNTKVISARIDPLGQVVYSFPPLQRLKEIICNVIEIGESMAFPSLDKTY